MPLSDEHKVLFIHIPKTGGTTIEQLFNIKWTEDNLLSTSYQGDVAPQHFNVAQLQKARPNKWVQYYKFTFVRNPWDRLVSTYHWFNRGCTTFELFVKYVYSMLKEHKDDILKVPNYRSMGFDHLVPQHEFVTEGVNVFRFEEFAQGVSSLMAKFDLPIERYSHANSTKHAHYSTYYSAETQQMVAELYARDIEQFGYKFERQ